MSLFIHLNAHSHYTLLNALPTVEALAKHAAKNNFPALGITETNNLFSAVEVSAEFTKKGVQPLIGMQLNVQANLDKSTAVEGFITLLVQNNTGWKNLSWLATRAYLDHPDGAHVRVNLNNVLEHAEGLLFLTGGAEKGIFGHIARSTNHAIAGKVIEDVAAAFKDRTYIELQRHGILEETSLEPFFIETAKNLGLPLVATNDARILSPAQQEAFEVMQCIGQSRTLADPDKKLFSPEHYLKSPQEMATLFADLPEAVEQTIAIAKRCGFWLEKVSVKSMFMPKWPTQATEPPVADIFKSLTQQGLEKRLVDFVFTSTMTEEEKTHARKPYDERLVMEQNVIINMGFEGYFLITSDFIKWSKTNDIPVGPGRGSGAGSLCAWALEITDLDPIRWNLYFERFLNPDRVSLPDFDIDFAPEGRDRVIEYVRKKYSDENVAHIITFGTLGAKAVIRDVGRVLQMPYAQAGRVAAFIPGGPNPPSIEEALKKDEKFKALYDTDAEAKRLLNIAKQLEGANRHASTHAAGVIIADRPIVSVCPLYLDPRSSTPATQLSMYDAENAGLVKFDFLGLKTLTIIQLACKFVSENQGKTLDPLQFSLDDEITLKLLRDGHTTGVFQVESPGMTDLLRKVKPTHIDHLAAVICLYRPGPMELIGDYVKCHLGTQQPYYAHPLLEPELKETYGVAIYQEQVLRMAQVLAGYSLGQADLLRRAMGKKLPEEMAKERVRFVEGCKRVNNISEDLANSIFVQIERFAGYGFNKAHTMAYTVVAWQTAYLKANFPLEFMTASLIVERGNTDKLLEFKQEATRMGLKILPPCINASNPDFSIEGDKIRYALNAIKGAGDEVMVATHRDRATNGTYKNVFEVMERLGSQLINKRQLEVLIKAGAFDTLHPNRAELFENTEALLQYGQPQQAQDENQIGLFAALGESTKSPPPALTTTPAWDMFTQLEREHEAIGFYLSAHPLQAFANDLTLFPEAVPVGRLADFSAAGFERATIIGIPMGLRDMKTKAGKRMGFLTLSDTTGQVEVALFPESYDKYQNLLTSKKPLIASINLQQEGDRLRTNIEELTPFEAAAATRKKNGQKNSKVQFKVATPMGLQAVKAFVETQAIGATPCEIIYTITGKGEVCLKLDKTIENPTPYSLSALQGDGISINIATV